MVKLVASDLDGTLLLNDAQTLNPEIFDLIRELRSRGILFAAASGRQYANMRRLFEPVKDDIIYICENGALIIDKGRIIYKETIERSVGEEILRTIRDRENCEILLSGENTSYIQPKKEEYLVLVRDVLKNNCTVVEDIMATGEDYMKISVYEEDIASESAEFFAGKFSDKVKVVTSGYAWLDMIPLGVDKGAALGKIRERYGIGAGECMAFGDNYNDAEMLEQAGISFAMDTAQPGIRKLCRYHTDTVEHALERFLSGGMDFDAAAGAGPAEKDSF